MGYRDLGEFFDPDLLLPINGKEYRIASPNAEAGLRLRTLFAAPDATTWSDDDELAEVMGLLGATKNDDGEWVGGAWSEMAADGIAWPAIWHAGRTALMHFGMSPTLAEVHWVTGAGDQGNPTPPAPKAAPGANRATKRASAKKSTSRSRARTARTTPAAPPSSPS
jgi:hypothetical protein